MSPEKGVCVWSVQPLSLLGGGCLSVRRGKEGCFKKCSNFSPSLLLSESEEVEEVGGGETVETGGEDPCRSQELVEN